MAQKNQLEDLLQMQIDGLHPWSFWSIKSELARQSISLTGLIIRLVPENVTHQGSIRVLEAWAEDVAQLLLCLASVHKALDLIPSKV